MNQEELTALIVIKIENLGIDYRTFNYDNQRAWIGIVCSMTGVIRTERILAQEWQAILCGQAIRSA